MLNRGHARRKSPLRPLRPLQPGRVNVLCDFTGPIGGLRKARRAGFQRAGSWVGRTSKIWTRIEAMNLVDLRSSALPRSVTAQCYDAPERVTRWVDWFRLATYVSIGERWASRWKDLFFSDPGRARWRGQSRKRENHRLTYAKSFVARARSDGRCH